MIQETYVSFEIAKLLKEKGFDERLYTVYSEYGELHRIFDKDFYENTNSFSTIANSHYNDITKYKYDFFVTAPTLQMAMKWLREVHKLSIEPYYDIVLSWVVDIKYIGKHTNYKEFEEVRSQTYNSYEQACEAAIKYSLENLI